MKTLIRTLSLMALSLLMIWNNTPATVDAGTYLLSNNGDGFRGWTITGEPTLVMNGFDLPSFTLTPPITIDTVRMSVEQFVAGQNVEAVIYQDFNGGNPVDAVLVARQSFPVTQTGVFIGRLTTPVQITAPVVWVGFYMPVGFRFRSDQSGSSVLTYWGWTPNTTFDLNNLRTATVFGPSDGTAPVNLNIGGIARITAEITPSGTQVPTNLNLVTAVTTGTTTGTTTSPTTQIIGSSTTNLSPMIVYPSCPGVFYDTQDIIINYNNGVRTFCNTIYTIFAIPVPTGYRQVGLLHDISLYGIPVENQSPLPFPITHCIRPLATDTTTALIGVAYGTPRQWVILPSVRFNDLVCAEMRYPGFISYFLPQR
ncbi:MAG: hypothetical protein SFZ02_03335 [bacterium]|nr:hypothetical protein [bacterium]